ncbi:MAG: type II toxin-antitoxin system RelE/ParE family toxin [Rhodoblastus sp.]
MKLLFTPQATRDLGEIADYVHENSPASALRIRTSILDALTNALAFPQIGRPQKAAGVRKLVAPRYGYLIYYVVDQSAAAVVVLSVQHPAREREHEDKE